MQSSPTRAQNRLNELRNLLVSLINSSIQVLFVAGINLYDLLDIGIEKFFTGFGYAFLKIRATIDNNFAVLQKKFLEKYPNMYDVALMSSLFITFVFVRSLRIFSRVFLGLWPAPTLFPLNFLLTALRFGYALTLVELIFTSAARYVMMFEARFANSSSHSRMFIPMQYRLNIAVKMFRGLSAFIWASPLGIIIPLCIPFVTSYGFVTAALVIITANTIRRSFNIKSYKISDVGNYIYTKVKSAFDPKYRYVKNFTKYLGGSLKKLIASQYNPDPELAKLLNTASDRQTMQASADIVQYIKSTLQGLDTEKIYTQLASWIAQLQASEYVQKFQDVDVSSIQSSTYANCSRNGSLLAIPVTVDDKRAELVDVLRYMYDYRVFDFTPNFNDVFEYKFSAGIFKLRKDYLEVIEIVKSGDYYKDSFGEAVDAAYHYHDSRYLAAYLAGHKDDDISVKFEIESYLKNKQDIFSEKLKEYKNEDLEFIEKYFECQILYDSSALPITLCHEGKTQYGESVIFERYYSLSSLINLIKDGKPNPETRAPIGYKDILFNKIKEEDFVAFVDLWYEVQVTGEFQLLLDFIKQRFSIPYKHHDGRVDFMYPLLPSMTHELDELRKTPSSEEFKQSHKNWICPISGEIMLHPVYVLINGERKYFDLLPLLSWFAQSKNNVLPECKGKTISSLDDIIYDQDLQEVISAAKSSDKTMVYRQVQNHLPQVDVSGNNNPTHIRRTSNLYVMQ